MATQWTRRQWCSQAALLVGAGTLGWPGALAASNGKEPAPTLSPQQRKLISGVLAFARQEKIDFLGVGDMTPVYPTVEAISRQRIAEMFRLPRVISFAFAKSDVLVDALPQNMAEYGKHDYGTLRRQAQAVSRRLAALLKAQGHRVAVNAPGIHGLPKMAARLAGLGWIGRSAMLITPQVGPRVVLEALLTDAPLPVSAQKPMDCHCGECRRCVDVCPAGAYTGEPFKETDPLTLCFDAEKCRAWREQRGDLSVEGACGLCVKVCPYGSRANLLAGAPKVAPPPDLLKEGAGR